LIGNYQLFQETASKEMAYKPTLRGDLEGLLHKKFDFVGREFPKPYSFFL
jgi:hypothetical protein